ncbi:MAG: TRL domain-containing protein [Leptospira sp.]|nr:TRL domain-containing protein [Leptospira sp.]
MKNILKLVILAALTFSVFNCTTMVTPAIIVKANGNSWVTSNDIGTKKEKGCRTGFFYLYEIGDAGVGHVAEKGGIKKISVVDYEIESYFWFFHRTCTIVYGE